MPTRKPLSKQELETGYNEVTVLYDLAEELLMTVESGLVKNPEEQLAIVEPIVTQIGDSADVLTEEYINVAENKHHLGKKGKNRIEMSLRKLYLTVEAYRARVGKSKIADKLLNIADPIIAKIERQVERVVAVFLQLLDISLTVIMNHTQLEQLRQHEARVALYMHEQHTHS